ncbi:MAG: AAA family ATPase, partial [Anaerolineae bacterium]|nr:AAA family ATPase [Anaerolineae bacterium]
RRWLAYYGDTRPDLPEGCPEKVDMEFIRWIWNYPQRSRPKTVALLHAMRDEKQIVWLQSPGAVRMFQRQVSADTRSVT